MVKSKKMEQQLKKFESDQSEEEEEQEQPQKSKLLVKDIFKNILDEKVEDEKNPIFAKFKKPLKQIKKKEKQTAKDKQSQKEKIISQMIGRKKPSVKDKQFERSMKIKCVKGVVQVFNAILHHQENNKD